MGKQNEIIKYMQNGELNLELLVKDYTPFVNSVLNNKVKDTLSLEDKEEIITDTFFILWKNKEKISTTIDAYLVGILDNLIKEKFKKRKIKINTITYDDSLQSIDIYNIEKDIKNIDNIENALNNLKDLEKKLLLMFYYEDMSIKMIAQSLNLSESNIKTKLSRIRKKIKKELKVGEK